MKPQEVFAAVRKDKVTGGEFVDLGTVAHEEEASRKRSREPHAAWREANPLQRVGRFTLAEVRS